MIKVLVVEDSAVVREFLLYILGADPAIEVIGTADDGEQALEAVARTRPDVITMDIRMPRMDGLEATRRIMETHPTPIVIVSESTNPREIATTFRAVEAGAVAVLRRPAGIGHPDHAACAEELVRTVKLMSEIKVIRRWPRSGCKPQPPLAAQAPRAPAQAQLIAIGASTGGPPVLQAILAALPVHFPVPILIVQHMASGFTHGFVQWLAQTCGLPIHLAAHGDSIRPGHVYVAPDALQMRVERGGRIALSEDAPENGLRPAVSHLFRSVAQVHGRAAVAGLLSGMGRDGAVELKQLRDLGAVTFAQDKESSVVHGMPGAAILLDAATLILPPAGISAALAHLAHTHLAHTTGRSGS